MKQKMLTQFDEEDQEALRILGFTITIMPGESEMAALSGDMQVAIQRSGEDQLALVITLPNGREIAALTLRELLHEALDRGA